MDLASVKQRIKRERRYGDSTEACRKLGVTTQVFRSAMSKSDFDELTPFEIKVLAEVIDILDSHIVEKEKLAQC